MSGTIAKGRVIIRQAWQRIQYVLDLLPLQRCLEGTHGNIITII